MTWWKVLITWPYLLRIYTKSGSMTRKILKDANLVPESKRYLWLQKKAKYLIWLYSITLKVHNIEKWPKHKGCVLVANHQSNFDVLLLLFVNNYSLYAPLGFIAKEELKQNRLARRFIFLIDVLFIDRKNPRTAIAALQEAKLLIRVPRTMAIFPEGTRSHGQTMNEFKPGALKLAYQAFVPILPVAIINSYQIFDKQFRGKKTVHLCFHEPLEPQNFINIPSQLLAKNIETTIKQSVQILSQKK